MANTLQNVQTYQMANLAFLQNYGCFVKTSNTKFKDFETKIAQLGDTVGFEKPPRFNSQDGLVVAFQDAVQRVQTLTVDQAKNVSYAFTAQEFIFNVDDYMERFGKGAVAELATAVEANVARNCLTGPYRFYGDGVTPINSYTQLASALAMFRNFSSVQSETKGYISDLAVPGIIGSGLNQFATTRNNEIANSWELGQFSRCEWYASNLLPIHTAGTEGAQGSTLTVVSVTKNANDAVTSITFSGTNAALDADSVKQYDRFQFDDGVSGFANMRFRTFVGHEVSGTPVQFQATADAQSTAGSQVTVSINPPLKASIGNDQNINQEIQAGMTCSVLPSHRVGMITSGNPLFLAMPRLPEETPFPTANMADPETGVSMRMYHGSLFGQNQRGMVNDVIWGSTLVEEQAMALIFPV